MSDSAVAPAAPVDAAEEGLADSAGPLDRRRVAVAAVLVVAILALAVMALASGRSIRSVTEVRPVGDAIQLVPTPIAPVAEVVAAPVAAPRSAASAAPRTVTRTVVVETPATPAAPVPVAPPAAPSSVYADCPALGLPAPERAGGLQSLIALVPLFGPFSPEAFAFMPAFDGGFYFFGPMLPEAERALAELAPVLALITPGAQQLGQAGYDALIPFYEPYRQQFLDAEGDLAAQIAPVVEALVTAPGAECAIALEGVLAEILADRPELAA